MIGFASVSKTRRGGSNEYHNLRFWAEIRRLMCTPVNPVLLYKSAVQGSQNYIGVFVYFVICLIWI